VYARFRKARTTKLSAAPRFVGKTPMTKQLNKRSNNYIKSCTRHLPMKLTILPLGVRTNGEIVHTREMRLSSLRSAAARARHNYIMRCTLARPKDLRRTRPRERTRSVPMGTSNEMVVTVSHPAKVVAGMCRAGGCALPPSRGDTGPPNPPQLLSTPAICYRSMNRAHESGPVGTGVA